MDAYPSNPKPVQASRNTSSASRERTIVLAVAAVFALGLGIVLVESMIWYRTAIGNLLPKAGEDWQSGAILLALFASYAKKQVALVIAAILAMLGLGLSLHAMKEASQAELSNAGGFKLSFASFSPGICAFLAACAIVLAVIWKDDKFEASAPSQEQPSPARSEAPAGAKLQSP